MNTATAIRPSQLDKHSKTDTFICQTSYDDLEAAVRITVLSNTIAALALPILVSATRDAIKSEQDLQTLYQSVDDHLTRTIERFISHTQEAGFEFKTANAYIRQETCIYGACQTSRQRDVFRSTAKQFGQKQALEALYPNAVYAVTQLKQHLTHDSPLRAYQPIPEMVQLAALTALQPVYHLNAGESGLEIHLSLISRNG